MIILFIKLQFFIRCNQAFRLLRTSTSNIYLNLSLNPNGLVTCIIPDIFVSYRYTYIISIRLMISDMHLQRSLHLIKSSPGLRNYQAWRPLVYPPRGLHLFRQYPDIVMEDEADVRTKEKS